MAFVFFINVGQHTPTDDRKSTGGRLVYLAILTNWLKGHRLYTDIITLNINRIWVDEQWPGERRYVSDFSRQQIEEMPTLLQINTSFYVIDCKNQTVAQVSMSERRLADR